MTQKPGFDFLPLLHHVLVAVHRYVMPRKVLHGLYDLKALTMTIPSLSASFFSLSVAQCSLYLKFCFRNLCN